jgi:hypothetical protein
VPLLRRVPTIWLMIDGSGSMRSPLSQSDPGSRWNALRRVLMDPQSGVVRGGVVPD